MTELMHADIFFFIASIATVAIAIAAVVVLVYVATIFRDVREVVRLVRRQAELVSGDIDSMREEVRRGGSTLVGFFKNLWFMGGGKKSESKKQSKKNEH